jgi:hypothetical protein
MLKAGGVGGFPKWQQAWGSLSHAAQLARTSRTSVRRRHHITVTRWRRDVPTYGGPGPVTGASTGRQGRRGNPTRIRIQPRAGRPHDE